MLSMQVVCYPLPGLFDNSVPAARFANIFNDRTFDFRKFALHSGDTLPIRERITPLVFGAIAEYRQFDHLTGPFTESPGPS